MTEFFPIFLGQNSSGRDQKMHSTAITTTRTGDQALQSDGSVGRGELGHSFDV